MGKEKKYSMNVLFTILTAAILFILFSIIKANIFHYYYELNADIASEGILAKLIWDTGEWVPSSWYVAMETRIFNAPNLAAILYGLTKNMAISVGISCCIFTMGILGSAIYFVKVIGFDKVETGIFLLLCLILPNNLMMIDLLYLHASYYAPYVIILFITSAVYVSAIKKELNYVMAVITVVLQIMYGIQSVRGILVIAGPLFATEVLRIVYKIYVKEIKEHNWKIFIWCISLVIGGFLGGLFPYSVGQSFSRNIRRAPEKFINNIFPDLMKSIGIRDAGQIEKIILIVILICSILIAIRIISKVLTKKNIESTEWGILVFFVSPAATAVMLTFTTIDSSARYYFVLIFAMALSMVCLWKTEKKIMRIMVVCLVVFISVMNYRRVYIPIANSAGLEEDNRYKVVQYLEEKGYSLAYTDFENANPMMLMAEGDIIVGPIDDFSKMNCLKWMTSTKWYTPNVPKESNTAYIVTEARLESFLLFCEENKAEAVEEIKIGDYYIFSSDYNYTHVE